MGRAARVDAASGPVFWKGKTCLVQRNDLIEGRLQIGDAVFHSHRAAGEHALGEGGQFGTPRSGESDKLR